MVGPLRKVRFYLYHWRWLFNVPIPFAALEALGYRSTGQGEYKGIRIYSFSFSRTEPAAFLQPTLEALQLVERVDARRFRRIQREIRFIIHSELPSGAVYIRPGRYCHVDYTRYDFAKGHEWYLRSSAATLVHEATHGAVYSRYVAYTRRYRLRIERLCHSEELKFLRRLDTPDRSWSAEIAGVFDEQYFLRYFGATWVSKWRIMGQRISEVRKDH
jgi:hypothetical protein